ncbi:MAG: glucose-1-phosphate cytidylyltransferase [Kordiimonadaceae bacterium]|nr:glucose-1-phosphate cytidylyltransferase [Kordiimonadaceae bacterium]
MKLKNNLKVLILAGGYGTRLDDLTKTIPKPLVKIHKDPILIHVIRVYLKFGLRKFYVALGFKGEEIIKYFLKDKIDQYLNKKIIKLDHVIDNKKCEITLIKTGIKTMTGGRLLASSKYIKDKNFLFTYGDGLSDINIDKVIKLHLSKKRLITMTIVNPPARFGLVKFNGNLATEFKEKNKITNAWINGGFFMVNQKFIKYIKNSKTVLEESPLEIACKKKQLTIYKHRGFWQCMDTKRDLSILRKIIK